MGVHLSSDVVRNASGYRTASNVFFINFENKIKTFIYFMPSVM